MLQLRSLRPSELRPASSVVAASGLSTSLDDLRRQDALAGSVLVGAWHEGALIGVAGACSYGARGIIGPMSVLPESQGQGAGAALLHYLLDWLRSRDIAVITLDATAAGAPLYRRHGFVTDHWTLHLTRSALLRLSARRDDGREAAEVRVTPATSNDLPGLARFDKAIFGADRGAMLASFLAHFAGRAVVARRGGTIAGYAVVQRWRIGPYLASDAVAATALIEPLLRLPPRRDAVISLAEINESGRALLAAHGFAEARRLERMRLGGDGHPGDLTRIYGLASYTLG